MASYYADKAFVSCKGLNYEHGIMDSLELFTSIKRTIMASASKCYLVVDSTKFDKTAFTRAGGIEQVAAVITDEKPDDRWLELFRRKGVECYYPKS